MTSMAAARREKALRAHAKTVPIEVMTRAEALAAIRLMGSTRPIGLSLSERRAFNLLIAELGAAVAELDNSPAAEGAQVRFMISRGEN